MGSGGLVQGWTAGGWPHTPPVDVEASCDGSRSHSQIQLPQRINLTVTSLRPWIVSQGPQDRRLRSRKESLPSTSVCIPAILVPRKGERNRHDFVGTNRLSRASCLVRGWWWITSPQAMNIYRNVQDSDLLFGNLTWQWEFAQLSLCVWWMMITYWRCPWWWIFNVCVCVYNDGQKWLKTTLGLWVIPILDCRSNWLAFNCLLAMSSAQLDISRSG